MYVAWSVGYKIVAFKEEKKEIDFSCEYVQKLYYYYCYN